MQENPQQIKTDYEKGERKQGGGRSILGRALPSLVSGKLVSCFVMDSSSSPVGMSRLKSHLDITAFTALETTWQEMSAFFAVCQRSSIAIIRFLLNVIFYCCSSGQIPRELIHECRH